MRLGDCGNRGRKGWMRVMIFKVWFGVMECSLWDWEKV